MPITKTNFKRGNFDGAIDLPFGNYVCELKDIEDCDCEVWEHGVKTDKTEAGLKFILFSVQGKEIRKSVAKKTAPNSNLYKFLSGMAPAHVAAAIQDDDKLCKLINGLIGKSFIVQIGANTTGKATVKAIIAAGADEPDDDIV